MPSLTLAELQTLYRQAGQDHVFQYYDQLPASQQQQLLGQLAQIDPQRVNSIFSKAMQDAAKTETADVSTAMEPLPSDCYESVDQVSADKVDQWRQIGVKAVTEGKVGVLLLAGGQGTRLGSSAPKGCYDIGLPSHKSLFQLQAERILKIQQLSGTTHAITWYIMTSGPTRADTEAFFVRHNFFGLNKDHVIFFEQGVLPALTNDGKIILEDKDKVSLAPDGNGGVYAALRTSGVLDDMSKRGIQYVHAYCVDNCLVRVADPVFVGYCLAKKAQCGAKVVRKVLPEEPVGVVCKVNGRFGVVEYSEIRKEDAEKSIDGRLVYSAANIANHFYTVSFLKKVCSQQFEDQLGFHIAKKKIKHIDLGTGQQLTPSKPNGVKLELFIFDIFPVLGDSDGFAVLSVPRSSEFSPLKNAPGAGVDCPETSRRDIYRQSLSFLKAAGVDIQGSGAGVEKITLKEGQEKAVEELVIEVSPLVSYDGEGLSSALKGKRINVDKPTYISSLADVK